MKRAVVFAYHNVGVRCLSVLLAHNIEVCRVYTHTDDARENIWFDSVAALATRQRLHYVTPTDPNTPENIATLRALQPDFIFSFYYRHMLKPDILACASQGCYNLHGSLLPKYRGRAPVNWAVIGGEQQTGATLHVMTAKPDAGAIAGQQAVPILPDDTAFDVFQKVTVAAELTLHTALPEILTGRIILREQDLSQGNYYGGRKPADGRIDWKCSAATIHNLIRGVAPPYPGAFTEIHDKTLRCLRSRLPHNTPARHTTPCLYWEAERLHAQCKDGNVLEIIEVEYQGQLLDQATWIYLFGSAPVPLE